MNKNIHILIVEDDDSIASDIQRILTDSGYEDTSLASSGEQAVERIVENPPDLVLMDVTLPGKMDGIHTAARIRSTHNIPIIYLAVHSDDELIARAKTTEPYAYLLKPFREEELQLTIEMALYKHKMDTLLQEANQRLEQEITERKQAEEELRNHRDHLEELVKERTTELTKANEQLRQGIAERKRAEEAMRESEEKFRQLTENLDLIFTLRTEDEMLYASPAYETITGRSLKSFYENPDVFLDYIHPEDREQISQVHYDEHTKKTGVVNTEYRIIRPDGSVRWLRVKAVPVLNERGEIIRRAGFTEDITERKLMEEELRKYREHLEELVEGRTAELQKEIEEHKRTEEKLKRSERRYALAQRAANIGSWERNLADDTLFWSEQVEPIFGFNRGEFRGTREALLECIYPDDRPKLLEASRALVEEGQHYAVEHRIIWPDGSIRWVAELGDVVRDEHGKAIRIIGLVQDITERKRTEEALAEERNLLRTLIDNLPVHVYVKDVEGRFLLANKAVAETIGVASPDELIGKTDFNFSYPRELAEQYSLSEQRVIESGQPLFNQEEPNFDRKTGAPLWFLTSLIPFLDSQGNPVGAVGIARDITDRKRMEEELRQAKEAAEAANRAKSEFLANMSHEFRTPLNGILGYAQILKRDPGLTEKQHDGIETIQRSGDHLLTLINDILDLSKIEAGKLELEPVTFNLTESLKSLVEMTRLRAKQKGLTFFYKEESELLYSVYGDEKRLRQILLNLLGNAVKFTEQGRVVLRVTRCGLRVPDSKSGIQLSQSAPRTSYLVPRIRFEVEDTGIGIPSEQIERIFSPFEQVKDRRLYSEGTGLGLAISRRLVRMMNSELHVKSTVGQGSTFWFDLELPAVKDGMKSEIKQSRRIIGFKGKAHTILVVDDKEANRDVLKNMLLLAGFHVIEATDGQEAIDKTVASHPDLVLMDLVMPGMDGFEATRRIRQIPELNDVIVIAVSANVFKQTREKSVEAGCHDFIAKPVSKRILFNRLQSHLNVDWIYETEGAGHYSEGDDLPTNSNPAKPIIPPPIERLLQLNELALIGDIMEIHKVIQELEALDRKFKPFVANVRMLAKALKISEIHQFVGQFLKE